MELDLAAELSVIVRLLVASVFGALVGLEREIHEHPAGMRTHLLVSLGSAGFTVLSIDVFGVDGDPGRVAAQVVTGVGFLGAGAILKEGATIRGLTTAASLWAVAAVGMAAGAGAWGVAVTATDHRHRVAVAAPAAHASASWAATSIASGSASARTDPAPDRRAGRPRHEPGRDDRPALDQSSSRPAAWPPTSR